MLNYYLKNLNNRNGRFIRTILLFMLILSSPFVASAQSRILSGIITDASNGEALIGAGVRVSNSTIGTSTDVYGKFKLTVPASAKTIEVTFLGYIAQTITLTSSTEIQVKLEQSNNNLNEVVVVGYGTMQKKDLTGAISQIRPDKIADQNPNTVQDILRGTPGLTVGFDPSAKGGGSIQIRGQRSVYTDGGHNDPLLILDGMIFYGELSEINPDDIEQIDVLKDASAAAVYGAKSANGVIIISTKKGKQGKPKINFTTNLAAVNMGATRKVFDPEGYLQYRQDWYTAASYGTNTTTGAYEAYKTGTSASKLGYYEKPTSDMLAKYGITAAQWRGYTVNTPGISDDQIWGQRLLLQYSSLNNYLTGKTFDWYNHSFRTARNQDYNMSVSGASDKIDYYMSLGYLNNQGVVQGNSYKAIRSNLKVNGKITDWLEVGANINFQDRSDGDIEARWYDQSILNSPFANYTDANGNLVVHPMGDDFAGNKGYNFDFDKQYMALEKGYTVLNTILTAKIKLPFNITYSFNGSPRYQWFYNRYFTSSEHPDWIPTTHGVDRSTSKRFDWSLNNTLNWAHTFGSKHRVNVTLVQEAEERQYWWDQILARNILPTDALGFHETSTGDKLYSSFDSDDSKETADGLLGRVFYSYDDRYMLTASVRRDGYSAFGTSNPRATFLSTAFAWTFTKEKFFNWKPLSNGKLRLSWGENGNRQLANPYIALANLANGIGTEGYVNVSSGAYTQYYYLKIDRLANTHLQWEKTTAYNAGLDLGFLNDRITGSFDYFIMPTHDMIMSQSLPGFSGFSSITTNLGEVENKGFEISINSQNIRTPKFSWSSTFGYSKYKNTIKHLYYTFTDVLDASGNVVSSTEVNDSGRGWFIGQPINTIWNYRVTGIWQTNEATEAARYGQRPGDPKVANNYTADDKVNTDGSITPVYNDNDKEFLGQTNAPIMWSLRNDFTYKDLSFSFNMYSYWGAKSLSGTYLNQDNGTSLVTYDANTYVKHYWTLDNPSNVYARLDAKGPAGVTSPGRLFDRSFIRLDNISAGYTLPKKWLSRYHIDKLKIYGNIRNVALWTKDKNWEYGDIETATTNADFASVNGIAPRIYTIGLNLTL
jgi:TonB-linked SusC/RagA family outer membrane protein